MTESDTMRPVRIRWQRLGPGIIVLCLLFLVYRFTQSGPRSCNTSYLSVSPIRDILPYCNSIDTPVTGNEGSAPRDKLKLELVQVLIRHGDRYLLHNLPNYVQPNISCQMGEQLGKMTAEMKAFEEFMQTDAVKVPVDHKLFGIDLFPKKFRCSVADLTPEGATQHVKNGAFLKDIYMKKWHLLSDNFADEIHFVSTSRARTAQSAMAFLYGFLPYFDLSLIKYVRANSNSMCSQFSTFHCTCPGITKYSDVMAPNFNHANPTYLKMTQPVYETYATVFGVTEAELPRPTRMNDINMIHACHKLPLPGRGDKCVPPTAVRQLYDLVNAHGQQQHEDLNYQKVVRLKMHPLIHEMAMRMEKVATGMSDSRFVLYSGHDTSVEPLATALGFGNGRWPPYASRIILELYSLREDKNHFLRVLYNGEDVTSSLRFCQPHIVHNYGVDLCPLEHFLLFAKTENIKDLGWNSYQEACAKSDILAE